MPLDVCKTQAQVRGLSSGLGGLSGGGLLSQVRQQVAAEGYRWLWRGSSAAFLSTLCGHLPWYSTFNALSRAIPSPAPGGHGEAYLKLARNGLIGFSASVVSDCCTNSFRVVKAIRQAEGLTYGAAVALVVREDGLLGLFGRGLKTRILANGVQGLFFTALWKRLEEATEKFFGS